MEWQEAQANPVIPFDKAELIEAMNAGVRQNELASALLKQGKAEGVVRVGCDIVSEKFEAEKTSSATTSGLLNETKIKGPERGYHDFPCQIRIDWLSPEHGIIDLKTCDDLDHFESDARKYRYIHQLAFYQAVLEAASGQRASAYIVAVEKREPFRCGVWQVPSETLLQARAENESAMNRLKEAGKTQVYVTGYENLRYIFM